MPGFRNMLGALTGQRGGGMPYTTDPTDQLYQQQAQDPNSPANQVLQHYLGQGMPQNVNPYLMFSGNNQFAQNHPKIAGGLDNVAGFLANMGPTADTVGDNISNVARGIMGNRQMHNAYMAQQYNAPFSFAQQVAGLQGAQTQQQMAQSQMQYQQQQGSYYAKRGDYYDQANDRMLQQTKLRNEGALDVVDEKAVKGVGTSNGKTLPERMANLAEQDRVQNGGQPFSPTERNNAISRFSSTLAGAAMGGRKTAGQAAGDVPQNVTDNLHAQQGVAKQMYVQDKLKRPPGVSYSQVPDYNHDVQTAESTFTSEFMKNPNLTFQQHFKNVTGNKWGSTQPSVPAPGVPSTSVTPSPTPAPVSDGRLPNGTDLMARYGKDAANASLQRQRAHTPKAKSGIILGADGSIQLPPPGQ